MHIAVQTRLLLVFVILVFIGIAGFIGAFVIGTPTVIDAQASVGRMGKFLDDLNNAQKAFQWADEAGRRVINGESISDMAARRDVAFNLSVSPELSSTLLRRFAAQDEQIRTVVRENGTLSFNRSAAYESMLSLSAVEQTFANIRDGALLERHQAEEQRLKAQWASVYLAGPSIILILAAFIGCVIVAYKALNTSRIAAETLRGMRNGNKVVSIHRSQIDELVREIEQRAA